jgi:hypothetical protein
MRKAAGRKDRRHERKKEKNRSIREDAGTAERRHKGKEEKTVA